MAHRAVDRDSTEASQHQGPCSWQPPLLDPRLRQLQLFMQPFNTRSLELTGTPGFLHDLHRLRDPTREVALPISAPWSHLGHGACGYTGLPREGCSALQPSLPPPPPPCSQTPVPSAEGSTLPNIWHPHIPPSIPLQGGSGHTLLTTLCSLSLSLLSPPHFLAQRARISSLYLPRFILWASQLSLLRESQPLSTMEETLI